MEPISGPTSTKLGAKLGSNMAQLGSQMEPKSGKTETNIGEISTPFKIAFLCDFDRFGEAI